MKLLNETYCVLDTGSTKTPFVTRDYSYPWLPTPKDLAEKKAEQFGNTPLIVTIQGAGAASGKTTLQFFLADFLKSRGYAVCVSDQKADIHDIANYSRYHRQNPPSKIIPQPVFLHVSDENVCDLSDDALDKQEPLRW